MLLGFAAVNTGNNLLYLLVSALLGFMVVSGLLGRRNLAALQVALQLPEEVFDGVATLATLQLTNKRRRLPAFLLEVELFGQRILFPVVGRGETATRSVPFSLRGRGRHTLDGSRLSSSFPINFFVRRTRLDLARPLVVFPALRPCRAGGAESRRPPRGERPLPVRGSDGELRAINDYRGGEPLKLIHWKLSARHDTLKVKELATGGSEPVLIDPAALPGAGLEERLRCAAFLVDRLLRENRPVGLLLAGRRLPPATGRAHRLHLLTELACHGQD